MKRIAYTRPDGGVSIVTPAEGARLAWSVTVGEQTIGSREENAALPVDSFFLRWPVEGATVDWAESEADFLERVRARAVPDGVVSIDIEDADLPADRDHRDAWRIVNGAVVVDESVLPRLIVPAGRVKLELNDRGLYAQAKALAEALGPEGVVYWSDFKDWESDHPKVLAIGASLDPPQDAAAVRAIFAAAAARDA